MSGMVSHWTRSHIELSLENMSQNSKVVVFQTLQRGMEKWNNTPPTWRSASAGDGWIVGWGSVCQKKGTLCVTWRSFSFMPHQGELINLLSITWDSLSWNRNNMFSLFVQHFHFLYQSGPGISNKSNYFSNKENLIHGIMQVMGKLRSHIRTTRQPRN